jgi:hypothetical protein
MTQDTTAPRATALDVDEIRARRIVIVDKNGRERIELSAPDDQPAQIVVNSERAIRNVLIASGDDELAWDAMVTVTSDAVGGRGIERSLELPKPGSLDAGDESTLELRVQASDICGRLAELEASLRHLLAVLIVENRPSSAEILERMFPLQDGSHRLVPALLDDAREDAITS